jgi:transcriptional regulator with XRE-family HTH domain
MKLKDFLYFEKISITDFAKSAGISRNHMSGIANGFRHPSKSLMGYIKLLTHGKVTDKDFTEGENNLLEKK